MDIVCAFYEAMPDDLTLEKCAEGVDIEFTFEGVLHTVNTAAPPGFRTRTIEDYYNQLENKVRGLNV